MQRTNGRMRLGRLMTTVFAAGFVASIFFTISAFAAANLFKIQNAELSELSATAEGAIASFDEENIVSDVTFHKLDDFAKYTITLKNTDSVGHVIESITDDNENPYVSYEYSQHAGEQIDAGADLVFVVTAKYTTAVTDTSQRAQATNVRFFIHFTDIDEEIPVVPNTGASTKASSQIYFSVASLVISAAGLTIIGIIALKKHKKASKYIIAGIIAVAAVATTATVKAATVAINSFTLTTNYTLKDRLVITWTDANGDEHETLVPYNEPANIPNPNKDGHTFTGWVDENNNPVDLTQPITEDIKVRPTFRAHKYTIRFNGNGATSGEMTDLAMTFGEAKTLPANAFTWAGHEYTGWDTEANGSGAHYGDAAEVTDLTTEDNVVVVLYAQWSVNPFHIDYDGNGATSGEMATTNCEYDQSCILRDNAFSKPGYHFTGWKYNNNDYANKADVTNIIESGTITMVAQWAANHYTIIFDINTEDPNAAGNMADMANLEYDHDYTLTANAFTRTGYNFGGWNTEIDGRNFGLTDEQEFHNLTTTDNAVITLYAQWTPTEYTIIFHANNENVENPDAMAAQVVTYDEEVALNANTYTWWQHKLVEWTTNANGTGTKYADKAVIKNLNANGGEVHLYAKWREIDAALDGRGSMTNKGINTKLKAITTANPDAKNFLHYPNGEPSDEIKASATDLSGTVDPIYAWVDGENIYWWSEDVKPRISTNNSIQYHYYGVGKSTTEGNVNNLEYMDLTGFDTTGIVDALCPFEYTNIKRVDISDWDLSNATDMSYFAYHSNLEDIIFPEHFDIQKVTNLNMAFSSAKLKKLDFRGWKTRDLRYLTNFIQSMPTITEVTFGGDFKTDNVTSMSGMINANANLATINNINTLNTAKVTSMRSMFDSDAAITSLDLSTFDTTALTDMAGMFKNMSGLTSLTLKGSFAAANVTNMEGTFYGVKNINTFDLSNLVSKPTNLKQTFAFTGGGAIETIDISNMDLSDVTTVEWTFFNANSGLKTIYTSSSVNPEVATDNTATFQYDTGLVGGANTHTYDVGGISSGAGSRIDDPDNGEPGYFTIKGARYIRYHDNDGDDTNDEANYALMKSHYLKAGGSLTKNAFVRDGYVFNGWKDADDNDYADEQVMTDLAESKTPLNLYAAWEPKTLTITFDKNDTYAEGEMGTQTVTYTATETLNANTFTNYQHTFLGWNTQADGKGTHYDNHTEIEITIPHDFTLYAEWKAELEVTSMNPGEDLTMLSADKANEDVQVAEGTKCKRAIRLHEEICVSGHCTDLGYTETGSKGTNVVRYGSFGTQGGPLNSGDAFTCDVDGNGVFDEKYERFYYVSDYWNTNTREFEDDTAVLIYYRSTYLGQGNTAVQSASYRRDITLGPDVTNMPRNSLWRNVSLKNTERNILAFREGEEMTNEIEAGTLPSNFSYEGYSARYLTIPEAKVGCGVTTIQGNGTETDSTCMYMYENSRFVINDMGRTESIGVPLENPYITHGATAESDLNSRWYIQSRNGAGFRNGWTSSRISARPVIEVPKDKISY